MSIAKATAVAGPHVSRPPLSIQLLAEQTHVARLERRLAHRDAQLAQARRIIRDLVLELDGQRAERRAS